MHLLPLAPWDGALFRGKMSLSTIDKFSKRIFSEAHQLAVDLCRHVERVAAEYRGGLTVDHLFRPAWIYPILVDVGASATEWFRQGTGPADGCCILLALCRSFDRPFHVCWAAWGQSCWRSRYVLPDLLLQ